MIQIGNKDVDSITIGGKEVQTITIGGKTAYEKQQEEIDYFYIQNTYGGSNTITITTTDYSGSSSYATSVEYSKDKTTWTTLNLDNNSSKTISMSSGDKVYFRNDSGVWNNGNGYHTTRFSCNRIHNVGGNLISLLDYKNMNTVSMPSSCFYGIFKQNTKLTDASKLVLERLSNSCYYHMFNGCTSLTTPPPTLPSTIKDYCYYGMFSGCTSLATAPELPATSVGSYSYTYMFSGCTALTTAPTLLATTLKNSCYYGMFEMSSYRGRLKEITTYANNISASSCITNWLNNVATTGDFYNLGSATYSSGKSGIPTGWTEHKIKMTDVVLTPATGTEYSVTANLEWSSNLTWTSAEINISNADQGSGNRNAYLTFTPSEVVNGVLTTANNIDVWFSDPDTWFTLTIYNNGTVVDTQYITYTTQ